MTTETLLVCVLVVLVLGVLPTWPYSTSWGYAPTGVLTLLLVFLLIWAIAGGGPLFRNSTGQEVKTAAQDVGQDIKAAGRNVADSIRNTVQ